MLLQSAWSSVSGHILAAGPETALRDVKDKALRKLLPQGSIRLASAVFAWYNSADFWYLNTLRAHRRPGSAKNRNLPNVRMK